MDGTQTIEAVRTASEKVLSACMTELWKRPVVLEYCLLKPQMITGTTSMSGDRSQIIAVESIRTFQRSEIKTLLKTRCFVQICTTCDSRYHVFKWRANRSRSNAQFGANQSPRTRNNKSSLASILFFRSRASSQRPQSPFLTTLLN